METKCNAGKFKLLEEIGLILPHKTLAVLIYIVNIHDSWTRKYVTALIG